MNRHLGRAAVVFGLAMFAVACSEPVSPAVSGPPSLIPFTAPSGSPVAARTLPGLLARPQQPDCGSLSLVGLTLQGSPADGVYAQAPDGARIPIHWTDGTVAEFYPSVVIRQTATRAILAVAGDDISDGLIGNLAACGIAAPTGPLIEALYLP